MHQVLLHWSKTFFVFSLNCRSMTLRLHTVFSMWQWEAFPRATGPSSSPITTSASTVSQPGKNKLINIRCSGLDEPVLFLLLHSTHPLRFSTICTLTSHTVCPLFAPFLLFRQVLLQHPVQLWGHAGDHPALCSGSCGCAWPAGGGTSLPQRVGVSLVYYVLINGSTYSIFHCCCTSSKFIC